MRPAYLLLLVRGSAATRGIAACCSMRRWAIKMQFRKTLNSSQSQSLAQINIFQSLKLIKKISARYFCRKIIGSNLIFKS